MVRAMSYKEICEQVNEVDRSTISEAVSAMHVGMPGAHHAFLRSIVDSHLKFVHERIAAFLGDEQNTSGGTMGAPHSIPFWMYRLNRALLQVLIKIGLRSFFKPPWSKEFRVQVFLTDLLDLIVNYPC